MTIQVRVHKLGKLEAGRDRGVRAHTGNRVA